jgi:hypothetical protein
VRRSAAVVGAGATVVCVALPWLDSGDGKKGYVFADVFLAGTALLLAGCLVTAFRAAWNAARPAGSVAVVAIAALVGARMRAFPQSGSLPDGKLWGLGLDVMTCAVGVLLVTATIGSVRRPSGEAVDPDVTPVRWPDGLWPSHWDRPVAVSLLIVVAVVLTGGLDRAAVLGPVVVASVIIFLAMPLVVSIAAVVTLVRTRAAGHGMRRPVFVRKRVLSAVSGLAVTASALLLAGSLFLPWAAEAPPARDYRPIHAYEDFEFGVTAFTGAVAVIYAAAMLLRGRRIPAVATLCVLFAAIVAVEAVPAFTASHDDEIGYGLGGARMFVAAFAAFSFAFFISHLTTDYRHSGGAGNSASGHDLILRRGD